MLRLHPLLAAQLGVSPISLLFVAPRFTKMEPFLSPSSSPGSYFSSQSFPLLKRCMRDVIKRVHPDVVPAKYRKKNSSSLAKLLSLTDSCHFESLQSGVPLEGDGCIELKFFLYEVPPNGREILLRVHVSSSHSSVTARREVAAGLSVLFRQCGVCPDFQWTETADTPPAFSFPKSGRGRNAGSYPLSRADETRFVDWLIRKRPGVALRYYYVKAAVLLSLLFCSFLPSSKELPSASVNGKLNKGKG